MPDSEHVRNALTLYFEHLELGETEALIST